ncbi:uncharacterized protein BKA55DRAFT_262159 [Fusarium redolens]|uniref:Uncharacterized protein n=1 Tax=Fusarium redolens TaxID=48865 RepID=A0A9P9FVH0_FUSRE|nr:uncharacterized protein BKA55DRAFT_262159 [Fusarium redolens]KAH7208440.1 hypothetical protein BKA55DRAFT_262159 [Fusarium redolens]
MTPQLRSSGKVPLGKGQPYKLATNKTSNKPSTKRKASNQTGSQAKKSKKTARPEFDCVLCFKYGIRGDRLKGHEDKCPNRHVKCACRRLCKDRYEATSHGCFKSDTGDDLLKGEWCHSEIQTVKLLYIWDGAPENRLCLFPGRSAEDLRRMSEIRWIRCPVCNYAATETRILFEQQCSNCHSDELPVCGICSKNTNHTLCGTKERFIDTHNPCAVDDYFKMCFRYMPESALEKLVCQWNLGYLNESYARLKPNVDQHEQNVEAAVSILKTPHARQNILSEHRDDWGFTPAWSELLKKLQRLAESNSQSLSTRRAKRYLAVDHFIFDPKTFKIKIEEKTKFPNAIVPQGGRGYCFEEVLSRLFSVSWGEHKKERIKLTMDPRKPVARAKDYLFCKPCRFATLVVGHYLSHNISSHPEKKNPEFYQCLICGEELNIYSRDHECRVTSREVRFGTRDLFMAYWLKFMEINLDTLRELLSAWVDLKSPVCSEFRKYLESRLEIKKPTKQDLIYPLCVLLRWVIRSREKKESPRLVLQNLMGKTKVKNKTSKTLNFIFNIALEEQSFFLKDLTRNIYGMQEELEIPKVVGDCGVDILQSLEPRYHPEWELSITPPQSTEAHGYQRFDSSTMENAQGDAIHVQSQSYEAGTASKPAPVVEILSDEDTDSINGMEAHSNEDDAMSSAVASRSDLGQAESENLSDGGFYHCREASQAEESIDDDDDDDDERQGDSENSSNQHNRYIQGSKEEHRHDRFISSIDLQTPVEKLKELDKDLTDKHLEDLNCHHFDDIDLNLRNLVRLKTALKSLLEAYEPVQKSIPQPFSLEWSDQMVDGIDLKTPTEQLKKLEQTMAEKQCEDLRCGRYETLALDGGKLTRFGRAMKAFVPASVAVQQVLATWESHTG